MARVGPEVLAAAFAPSRALFQVRDRIHDLHNTYFISPMNLNFKVVIVVVGIRETGYKVSQ